MKNQILYIFDPLCGWCYGFSENMVAFSINHHDQFEFVPIAGGMVTGNRVAPYSEIADYIKQANPRVEITTGAIFGDAYKATFLEDGTALTDSEPPSRALLTFRTFKPGKAISFAHELQKAHFSYGKDYNDDTLYVSLAKQFELDPDLFIQRFQSDEMKQNVQDEFTWVKESGIQGFPTVVYRAGKRYYQLAHGYTTVQSLEDSLEKAKKMVS